MYSYTFIQILGENFRLSEIYPRSQVGEPLIKVFVGITGIMGYLLEVLNVMSAFMWVGREGMRKGLEIKSLTGG